MTGQNTAAPTSLEVVVITRDRAKTLQQYCLPGLLDIAAHGGSVGVFDQSEGIETERLLANLPISYSRLTSRGLSAGRNEALNSPSGDWILFTDDDVVPSWDWYRSTCKAIQTFPHTVAVLGRGRRADGTLMRGGRPGEHWWPTDLFSLGSGYSFALRRSAGLAVGGFDPSFGAGARFGAAEDTLMLYRLLVSGLSIVCSDDVEIIHPEWRTHGEEVSRQFRYGRGTGALVFLTRSASVRAYAARRLSLQRALISESITQGKWTEAFSRASYLVGYIHPLDKIRLLIGGLKDHPMSFQALSEE